MEFAVERDDMAAGDRQGRGLEDGHLGLLLRKHKVE
jgi:hypothetical protein